MSFEGALRQHLGGDATLAQLVGDRIHPVIRPEGGALPAITFQVIALDQNEALGGRASSLRRFRVQIDVWADRDNFTRHLLPIDAALRARMDTAAQSFRSTMLPSGFDDFEPDTKVHRRSLEYSCWFSE